MLPVPGRHGLRRGAGRGRARRQARVARLQRAGGRRVVEGLLVDLQSLPHRGRLHRAAHQPVPERHAERRHLARVPRRRLRDRAPHRGHDVRRRRAVVAGAAAAPVDPRAVHHRALPADPSELRDQPGHRPAVPDLGDGARADLERLHPLHRRRRGAGGRADHAGAHAADHRQLGRRGPEGLRQPARNRPLPCGPSARSR